MEPIMSERTIDITFPVKENILLSLKENKEDFTKEVLFSSALLLYRKRKLSLGKAAELAGFTKIDFIEKLNEENEFIFDFDDDELNEIIDDANRIKTV
jgi:predicted HTH domain antitoxin